MLAQCLEITSHSKMTTFLSTFPSAGVPRQDQARPIHYFLQSAYIVSEQSKLNQSPPLPFTCKEKTDNPSQKFKYYSGLVVKYNYHYFLFYFTTWEPIVMWGKSRDINTNYAYRKYSLHQVLKGRVQLIKCISSQEYDVFELYENLRRF